MQCDSREHWVSKHQLRILAAESRGKLMSGFRLSMGVPGIVSPLASLTIRLKQTR